MADESASTRVPRELQLELDQSRASSARLLEKMAQQLQAIRPGGAIHASNRAVREIAAGIEQQVRRRPLPAILAAVIAGYLLGRALKFRAARATGA